jgi:hypothetical protein
MNCPSRSTLRVALTVVATHLPLRRFAFDYANSVTGFARLSVYCWLVDSHLVTQTPLLDFARLSYANAVTGFARLSVYCRIRLYRFARLSYANTVTGFARLSDYCRIRLYRFARLSYANAVTGFARLLVYCHLADTHLITQTPLLDSHDCRFAVILRIRT